MSKGVPPVDRAGDPDAAAFWDACAEGRLIFSRCTACDRIWFPPRAVCSQCGGACVESESGGKGEVVTWSRVHRTSDTGFGDNVPYVVAMIALDEGFRMMANVEPQAEVEIGKRCRVTFRPSPATGQAAPLFVLEDR